MECGFLLLELFFLLRFPGPKERISMDKKIVLGWEVVPYLLLLVALFIVPREASIFDGISAASLKASSWTIILMIVVLASSMGLTFEGFMRFSRYRMSRDHQCLNMAVSLAGTLMPFCVLFMGPIATVLAYLIIAYSYFISPRDPETIKDRTFYQRKYFAYVVNAALLSLILILIKMV